MTRTKISINEKLTIHFITALSDYEKTAVILSQLGFKYTYDDLTKENCGENYPFSESRKEVFFNVDVNDIKEAAFLKQILNRNS